MSKKWQIIILLSLGLLTHFVFFGHPNETVFDEVHFGKFISGYYTHEYFFDIHPPLGKMAIAGFAKFFDFKPGFAFTDIGNKYPDNQHLILRFLPNLAGALLPIVIYLLLIELGASRLASFSGGLLIVLENALLTQSHYILLDAFLLLFGFLAILFYFKSKNRPFTAVYYQLLFGLFAGLSLSVKWTGLSFLGLPLLIESIVILRNKNFKDIFKTLAVPLTTALIIYSVIFSAHLIILNKSGPGDAFMSQNFQKTLISNKVPVNDLQNSPPGSNLFQKFIELHAEMYKANQRLGAHHPYSSSWYSWPFMTRPIYYWVKDSQRIYLMGNPIIWWATTVAVILLLLSNLKLKIKRFKFIELFLLGGYIVNLLPFIGVKRIMFLYHYFTAYIFAIMILVWLIDQTKNPKKLFGILLVGSIAAFIFFAPLSYGLNLSPKAYELRIWLASWR